MKAKLPLLVACVWLPTFGSPAAEPGTPSVKEVIIVFKTHFDIGYTDMASNVVTKYRTTMMDQALKVVDANRDLPPEQQFAWTIPGWPMKQITEDWPGQTPERQRRVMQAFKDGRFVVHALPFTTHTELLSTEELVRGMKFSSDLSRAAGKPLPRDAKMTDVPSHSWFMPTLLRHAGVDFLHLGCNPASRSPQVPPLFWWEGPDGSRVLTMYSALQYGTGLVPPKDWPYQTWLALIHTGDNHGPPTPDEVKKLLDQAKDKLPGVKVRIGRLSDFSDSILAEDKAAQLAIGNRQSAIPVVRGDMPDTWIHGPMSDPQGAKLARNIRPAITTAELLNTMLRTWGVKPPDISDTVAKAYEQSLLYGEHTWGGSQSWITGYGKDTKWSYGDAWRAERAAGRFQRLESSWAEHTAYIENAQRLIQPVLESQMKTLAESVAQSGPRIVVFNPLPWTRFGSFTMAQPIEGVFSRLRDLGSIDSPVSQETAGVVTGDGQRLRIQAWEVPPVGYGTFQLGNSKHPEFWYHPEERTEDQMLLGALRLQLNPRAGAVVSAVRSDALRKASFPVSPYSFGQVLYERFDSNNVAAYVHRYVKINADWALNELGKPSMPPAQAISYRAASPTNFTVRYTNSWIAAEGIMEAPASAEVPFGVTTRVVAYNTWSSPPHFDLEITIHNKPADPWPEAAWVCLPFDIESPQFRIGRLGSIIDPAKDIVPGANHDLFAVDTGIAVFGADGRGFGICPLDSPLVSLGEPGGWKYTTNAPPKRAAVFVNLFNNQWTTNFRFWNEGTWTSRIRIWMFNSYDPWRSLIKPSLEARFPLQAAVADGPAGTLPLSASGVAVATNAIRLSTNTPAIAYAGGGTIMVTAFGANPDGAGTLLRLWEMAGRSGPRHVALPSGLAAQSVQPVDLRSRAVGEAIPVKDGRFEMPIGAFAPASVLLNTPGSPRHP